MLVTNPIELPFTDPVVVFTVLISIILVAPIVFKKFKIPGIIGLIVAGIIIGPQSLNLVEFGDNIKLLSTAGLLYLMFLAGLELNLRELMHNKNKSIVFGALTFFIPLILGFITAYYALSYNFMASLLIASMFSTHTLIAYPIASRLGITRSEAVTITIGGTIITDTSVLVLLAFISAATQGTFTVLFWIRIILSISAFSFLVLWGVPKISIWFFKNLEGESGSHYVFVLAMLFISGLLARAAGIEPIIGAFLAGLAMSSLIPPTSALMNRISFIGNNFFIPIFLLSVGLIVDFTVFLKGPGALIFSISLVIVAIFSKYLAAWVMQRLYKYSSTERQVIFGLSVSHAAAIIAVIYVGYSLKLIGLNILNGGVMIILVSCFIGSFITERYGRKLAVIEAEKMPVKSYSVERILVPVSNPATIEGLIDFAILIKKADAEHPLYMLSVVPDDAYAQDQILKNNKMFESAISHAAAADTRLTLVSRVDLNVANGISRAVKELLISKIVLGWNGKITTTKFFFGSIIENLISNTERMVMVVKSENTLNTINRIVVTIPENAECEAGFGEWIKTVMTLAARTSSAILFSGHNSSHDGIREIFATDTSNLKVEYEITISEHPIVDHAAKCLETDLYIVIAARSRTLSYSHYFNHMPRDMARFYSDKSFIIIYPEQQCISSEMEPLVMQNDNSLFSNELPGRYSNTGNRVRTSPGNRHNSLTE